MSRRSTVLLLLALLHAYVGARLLPDMPGGALACAAGVVLLALSYALMAHGVRSRGSPVSGWANRLVVAALFATGLFSSLAVLTLIRDGLLLALAVWPGRPADLPALSAAAVPVAALAASALGLANARRRARVVHVEVPLPGLPAQLHGFSIAQISDVHVGRTIGREYVAQIVAAVNALEADLIAVTGDLVDGPVRELAAHTQPLAALRARHGAFFVTGNHEYYSGVREWLTELRRLGLTVLLNEHVVLRHAGARLLVAGVTDYSAGHFDPAQRSDPYGSLQGAPPDVSVRILLAHQPRTAAEAARAGFQLQLSGHTHGGQFWPWMWFVRLQQPFTAGLHRLNSLWIYISRGTGYWGPPKRLGAPSEITLLRLIAA